MESNETVAIAMSGGVDSSAAAALLLEQGYQVIGLTMHLWDYAGVGGQPPHESNCCSLESIEDARAICHKLGIPHYVLNLKEQFHQNVIQNFIEEYLNGRTPNPCVLCNHLIKWGHLLEKARQVGADKIATGHYAKTYFDADANRYILQRGIDSQKDQSYALWGLTQEQLSQTVFPLGGLTKEKTRKYSESLELRTAQKSESQEICFIPDDNYERFLKEQVPDLAEKIHQGEVIDENGQVLGHHRGYPFYTIGQRKGLRVAAGRRIYVNRIDPATNRVYVGPKESVLSKGLRAHHVNWISADGNFESMEVTAKIRYKDPGFPAKVFPVSESEIRVEFESLQNAVTPGQSVVFYDGDRVVGGGIITEAFGK